MASGKSAISLFSPQERLFLYGRWQEGIEPAVGLKPKDRDQFQRLENLFSEFRESGSFTIPLELGLSSKFQYLDRLSFSDWLCQQGLDSRLLHWYTNYACRDDYGALASDTSAWAGIHYFSSVNPKKKTRSPGPKATAGLPAVSSNASEQTFAPTKWSTASRRRAAAPASSRERPNFNRNSSSSPPPLS